MSDSTKKPALVEVRNLRKYFPIKTGWMKKSYVQAVEDVSLTIHKGETLGLVGESGCGKTTLGRTIIRLHQPTAGQILYDGQDITQGNILPYRRKMQIIFQDPSASLNPRMTVGEIVGEALQIHGLYKDKTAYQQRIRTLLSQVGLNSEHANRFPHEFSGGQQQRIGIARALSVEPEFIVCDEPISALDVSIQSQIINMLEEMQENLGLTYLFIAHDISVVRHISDRIGVMYLGNLVELGDSDEVARHPLHPYTTTLLSAVPVPDPDIAKTRRRIVLEGDIPSPLNPPSGCRFHTRCPYAMPVCREQIPPFLEAHDGHFVACHLINR
jgi:oligopeptide transport system ATP-binding protein